MKKMKITFRLLAVAGAMALMFTSCSENDDFLSLDEQIVIIDDGTVEGDKDKDVEGEDRDR